MAARTCPGMSFGHQIRRTALDAGLFGRHLQLATYSHYDDPNLEFLRSGEGVTGACPRAQAGREGADVTVLGRCLRNTLPREEDDPLILTWS